jgi:outer membrane protein assembly factor BamB
MPTATEPRRRRRAVLAALAALILTLLGVALLGIWQGWFDPSSQRGTEEGFERGEAPMGNARGEAWPEFGRLPARTRANPELDLAPPFRRAWSHDAGSLLEFPPVVAGGIATVGTNAGRAMGLDVHTGRERWNVALRGRVASSPAIVPRPPGGGDPLALFTTLRGDLIALDLATGAERWRFSAGATIESSPLVADGSAYIGTLDGRVLRVDLSTRAPVWEARAGGQVKASLALSGPNVVVGDYAGKVTAFARRDGKVVWQTSSPGPVITGSGRFYAGPAVAYGRVYIGNVNGYVIALDADTGAIAWTRALGNFIYSSAAVAGETVYVGSYDGGLYALDAVTGEVKWRFEAGERISGSPSVIGPNVYVSTLARVPKEGRTYALDAVTGGRRMDFPDGRYTPAVAIDGLLLLTGVHTVYGLVPKDVPAATRMP